MMEMNKMQHKNLFFHSNPYNGDTIKVFKTVVYKWDEENFVVGVNEHKEFFKEAVNNSSFWFIPKKSNYDRTFTLLGRAVRELCPTF